MSLQSWHSLWRMMKRITRGELQLEWVEQNGHSVPSPSLTIQTGLWTEKNEHSARAPWPVAQGNGNSSLSSISSQAALSAPTPPADKAKKKPSLAVYCLGPFQVYQNGQLIEKWSGNKPKSVFKYMLTQRERFIHKDVLMDLFWRDAEPESARRNLYQAIYNLRQTLKVECARFSHILFEDSCYRLNPELEIWLDSEAFSAHYQTGQALEREGRLSEALREYEVADSLYQGEFLAEDLYEDWPMVHRENLKYAHLDILERLSKYYFDQEQLALCIIFCHKILAKDNCREDAHRRLMRCYLRQGQRHLALRQYHLCVKALERELEVCPMPATLELYEQIQKNQVQQETSTYGTG